MEHTLKTTFHPYPDVSFELDEDGSGAPILLLHGGGGPESVQTIRDAFKDSYRVLQPTHPGWAGTSRPDWFVGVSRLAEMYLDLIDDLDLHDLRVVGSSMGGWLAAEIALRDRGHRISHLVLMDASGLPDHAPTFPDFPPGSEWAERMSTMVDLLTAYGLTDPALPARLPRITADTLVIWGADDQIISPRAGSQFAELIPGATLTVIPEGGHVPAFDHPERTLPHILTFLER